MLGNQDERTKGIKRQAQELIDQLYERGFKDGKESESIAIQEGHYQQGLDDAWECMRKIISLRIEGDLSDEELSKIFGNVNSYFIFRDNTASEAIEKIKAWEEKKRDEIKVGTRARTIKDKDCHGCEVFPVGTVGVIEEIDSPSKLPYKISANGDYWWYSRDMFEVVKDGKMLVGDEVIHSATGTKAVVIDFVDDERIMVYDENGIAEGWRIDRVSKTGRHFDAIAEVLKQMREGK